MALTGYYKYADKDGDFVEVTPIPQLDEANGVAVIETGDSGTATYVTTADSVPLALNVLGYDRPEDERVSTGVFEIGSCKAPVASSQLQRDEQVELAAALLTAVDAYDKRTIRLATAEKRREAAAHSLALKVNKIASKSTFGNGEIGELREALGHYDAALAN